LLPFGEYLPLRTFFPVLPRLGGFRWPISPRRGDQPLLRAGGQPVGVSICFEAVFGSEIRRALPEATWLINLSNDAWFKDSTAPHQHLQIARMRALEVGATWPAPPTPAFRPSSTSAAVSRVHRRAVSGRGRSR
jgi:apolipoprotein N-acyltransferase